MVDVRGRSSARGGGNTVGDDLHREKTGNRGTVGGITTDIRSVCRSENIQRWWMQEGGLVAPRVNREKTSGHLDRILMGIQKGGMTGRESCAVGSRGRW